MGRGPLRTSLAALSGLRTRGCVDKIPYDSKADAAAAMLRLLTAGKATDPERINVYPCLQCALTPGVPRWHVGHRMAR